MPQEEPEEMTADDKPLKYSGRDEPGDRDQTGSHKHMAAKLD